MLSKCAVEATCRFLLVIELFYLLGRMNNSFSTNQLNLLLATYFAKLSNVYCHALLENYQENNQENGR